MHFQFSSLFEKKMSEIKTFHSELELLTYILKKKLISILFELLLLKCMSKLLNIKIILYTNTSIVENEY